MTASEKIAAMRHVAMPEGMERMNTGPIQFGNDWPGFFVRGDEAMGLAHLEGCLKVVFAACNVPPSAQLQILSDISCLRRVRECLLIDDREPS